ncbi:lasso peptide isopeptide bond-forming cyclase [Sediminibacterium sp.]|uniref:lasso peptide isopeptide bond-forming cyclase n=1 Tax=Sediminibacterium sp. TaxID=1917865 RepID=UPI0027354BD1|nr:lasso peptide isopeptide bond-forming cyclase [Sediminibacterium sp.]MDP3566396.1 lasso peptide isopeptide bond-forming cyclase [Sediminibacterium sp.]
MSAITGIFMRNGKDVDPELMKKMNKKLSHRGPDGSDIWCEGPIGLGHQMLWTTQESLHEKLPFEEKGLVITADARIDNRDELSRELGLKDEEDVSDSYFILKAYQMWGEDCPDKLLGDFAFAIWDKAQEKLFCARDHMGVKPFYYYLDDDMFVFGTEIKALFCIPEVPCELNELKVAFHLLTIVTDKKNTFYENIFSLTSAHTLTIKSNAKIIRRYWKLDSEARIIMDSDEDYMNAFRNIFSEAVNCRLRSAFPIGFELSGGLDSSFVVGMAKNILNKDKNNKQTGINTFSMIFDDFPQVDESHYIKKVVEIGGIKPHLIPSDNISPLKRMETILRFQEQPFVTSNMTILLNMYKKMKNNNIRVLLAGAGGDEIISYGTNYHHDLAVNLQWKKLIVEIKAFSKRYNIGFFKLLLQLVIIRMIPKYLKKFWKKFIRLAVRRSNPYDKFSFLNKEFANKLGGKKYFRNLDLSSIMQTKTAREFHYFMINQFSHQYTLEMLNKLASSVFIEPRYPYFDKRLVEFCYAIPDDMKLRSGWDRYIQRISMENILPEEIQWRPLKKYFDPVLEKNLLLHEKKRLNEIFLTDSPLLEKYINSDVFYELYKEYKSKSENSNDLWSVTILYVWFYESNILSKEI